MVEAPPNKPIDVTDPCVVCRAWGAVPQDKMPRTEGLKPHGQAPGVSRISSVNYQPFHGKHGCSILRLSKSPLKLIATDLMTLHHRAATRL